MGHKQLLNFDAWSTPDVGGWILFGVMGLLAGHISSSFATFQENWR